MKVAILFLMIPIFSACHSSSAEKADVLSLLRSDAPPLQRNDMRYAIAYTDLDGDQDMDAIVWLEGTQYCGSGGCRIRVFERNGGSFRLQSKLRTVKLPVRVLNTSSNGWKDLTVTVGGGGILEAYEARLKFDGSKYPEHPFSEHVENSSSELAGSVLIPGDTVLRSLFD